jgi:hypothetical protein
VPPRREKKEESEEEWEQIPPELLQETRLWWVEHQEKLAKLSRHPDDPSDAPGLALAIAHSLAEAGGAAGEAAGEAPGGQPVFDISDNDEDFKPDVKTEDGGAEGVAVAGAGATVAIRVYFLEIYVKPAHAKFNENRRVFIICLILCFFSGAVFSCHRCGSPAIKF